MPTFAAYIGLRDPARDSLQPDPETDPDLYVDLDGHLPRINAVLARRAPKLLLMGDYGTGKTHLLHRLKAREVDPDRFHTVYVKLEAHGPEATSRFLHDDILSRLEAEGVLAAAVRHPPQGLDTDVANAFSLLAKDPRHPGARAWLFGRGPTPTQSRNLLFSTRLSDVAGGVRYSTIWRAIGEAYLAATGKELLLMLDESETFQEVVKPGRAVDLGVAIRELFDTSNKSVGIFMGLTAPKARGTSVHPIMRPDVVTRVQDVWFDLKRPDTPERRRRFLTELLDRMLVQRSAFLSPEGIDFVADRGADMARRLLVGINRDPVQREFVKLLDRLGSEAYSLAQPLPLGIPFLEERALR